MGTYLRRAGAACTLALCGYACMWSWGCSAQDLQNFTNVSEDLTPYAEAARDSRGPVAVSGRGQCETLENGSYRVICPSFERIGSEQEEPTWCWAACTQMIRRYNGEDVSQREIVDRIKGRAHARTGQEGDRASQDAAGMAEIMLALNPDLRLTAENVAGKIMTDLRGATGDDLDVEIDEDTLADNAASMVMRRLNDNEHNRALWSKSIVEEVSAGQPLVAGLRDKKNSPMGHAYVVYEVTYRPRTAGVLARMLGKEAKEELGDDVGGEVPLTADQFVSLYKIESITLFDPWDATRVELSADDFASRVDFVVSKTESRRILQGQWDAVTITGQ